MMRFPLSAVLVLLAASAASLRADDVRVLVPVVGSVDGIGNVRWKTDVVVSNDGRTEQEVMLLLPTTDAPFISFSLRPGSWQEFPDVLEAFGLESGLSPLEIVTLNAKRSVRITANVYAVRGTEIIGPQAIPVTYPSDGVYPQRTLSGLSFSEVFRTNVGLANLGDHDATFTLALQRIAGRNVAITRFTLGPNSLSQISIQSLFPLITSGDNFMVLVETSSRDTYVYASVIDNATAEARFIQPAVGPPVPSAQGLASSRP